MSPIAKTIALALSGLVTLGAAAVAEPRPAADAAQQPASNTMTTGSVNVERSMDQRMKDCMEVWEPRTHMTKQQWRRTCKMSLKELSTP
jgi:hypothetical protein